MTNNIDDLFDDFDFGNDLPAKPALTSKELDYIKRGVFSKAFLLEMRAQKEKKDNVRLKELEPMIIFVKDYFEKTDNLDWYEERFLTDVLDSYPNGNRKTDDIIYQLTSLIQNIAFSACENNRDNKIHGDDSMNIKILAIFIIQLAEGRL